MKGDTKKFLQGSRADMKLKFKNRGIIEFFCGIIMHRTLEN
jgi:hypothetical protein